MHTIYIGIAVFGTLTASRLMAGEIPLTADKLRGFLEEKSANVSAARLDLSAARDREGGLRRSFLPSLELRGDTGVSRGESAGWRNESAYGLELKANLYRGGRDQIRGEIRDIETKRRVNQVKVVMSEELDRARTVYWQILYLREKLALLNTSLEINKQNLNGAQKRIRSGVAANSDRFEFEIKEADLKRLISLANVQFANDTEELKVILGVDKDSRLTFPETFVHDHASAVPESGGQLEFLFKDDELQGEQYLLAAREQERVWWPNLDVFASLDKDVSAPEGGSRKINGLGPTKLSMGLRATVSLPAGMESQREASALAHEASAAKLVAAHKERMMTAHVTAESAQLKALHDQVHETEQNIARAERYYKLTQSEYARGVKNSPDVLGASDKLFDARHSRLETIRDFQVARWHIVSKLGL
jgi:outer membrane protein TolC